MAEIDNLKSDLEEIQTARDSIKVALQNEGETVTNDIRTYANAIPNVNKVKTVNGVSADSNKNVQIDASKINIDDTATNKETVKVAINNINNKVTTLENKNVAELDENGKIPSSQLPSYVDDVLEFENKASFPTTGETGKIYVAKDTNLTWRWSGTDYVEISPSLALGETSSTAFRGDYGKLAYTHAVTNKGIEQATKGLYKFKTNTEGHITETTAVTKQDLTNIMGENPLFQCIPIRNQTVAANGTLQFIDSRTGDTYAVSNEYKESIFVFLNGEKLSVGLHYDLVSTSTQITGIQITNDWNIVSTDYIDVISVFEDLGV